VRPSVGRGSDRWVDALLALCLVVTAGQLVPLPIGVHDALTSNGTAVTRAVALGVPAATPRAPTSIDPESTAWAVALGAAYVGLFWCAREIFAFGGVPTSFNEVRFPGDRTNCAKCHSGNSQLLPLRAGLEPVTTLRDVFTPQGPGTAACLGCHDSQDAAAHAYLNTVMFPGSSNPSEACATCHGTGKDWAVEKVHAK